MYRGKPRLSENGSFSARESLRHWRQEIEAALQAGKLVVVFLAKPEEVYAHTGETVTDGRGRSARQVATVGLLSSYAALPIDISTVTASGSETVLSGGPQSFNAYWREFGAHSPYEVHVVGDLGVVALRTKAGDRTIGAVRRGKSGAVVLVPPLKYDAEELHDQVSDEGLGEDYEWNESGIALGRRLAAALAALASDLCSGSAATPPPNWCLVSAYELEGEKALQAKIEEKTGLINTTERERAGLVDDLRAAGGLRALLFEQGKRLEGAVLEALTLFGFTAEPVLAYDGANMTQIDAGGILDIAMAGTSATLLARKWESALLVNVDNDTLRRILENPEAMAAVERIEGWRALGNNIIEAIINKSEKVKELRNKAKDGKLTAKQQKQLTDEEKEYKSKRKLVQEKLIKFATRIPAFMYLTDFRENTLRDVITRLEPDLFLTVTGLTVQDFHLLVSLRVFNTEQMNQAVFAFRRYEDASLRYTGIDSHPGLTHYGLYDTVVARE
jgi:hypothetical protein